MLVVGDDGVGSGKNLEDVVVLASDVDWEVDESDGVTEDDSLVDVD